MTSTPWLISFARSGLPRSNVPAAPWNALENSSSTVGARNARAALPPMLVLAPSGTLTPIDPDALLNDRLRPGPNFGSSESLDWMRYASYRPPSCRRGTSASGFVRVPNGMSSYCLLYTSDAADERSSVDLGG